MPDVIIDYIKHTLPVELGQALQDRIASLENGDFKALLQGEEARLLLGDINNQDLKDILVTDFPVWSDFLFRRLGIILGKRGSDTTSSPIYLQHLYFIIGLAAFYAFLQSNVTGPPLDCSLLASETPVQRTDASKIRRTLVDSMAVDGEAAYRLTPNIELFCLAQTIFTCPPIVKNVKAVEWARLRADFWHQKLLSDPAPTLQKAILDRAEAVELDLKQARSMSRYSDARVSFLQERASIYTHHGLEKLARQDLEIAAKERKFEFVLTGRMGKRTKWQQKDTSQLVVLAQSHDFDAKSVTEKPDTADNSQVNGAVPTERSKPDNLNLNDDTLLESISFTDKDRSITDIVDDDSVPSSLSGLDPSNQPLLHPLDSIVLLALASSITNTSPADGLTREETLPYAVRVLEGGSSNWQVYTQGLLVRSRCEGHRSRTVERGLLQLQAVVDQVIADTTPENSSSGQREGTGGSTFLPRTKEPESAPVSERLQYVFPLSAPSRWELEAELAQRWVSLGGLRTALEIYERLEMWAEAALCWAATEREEKAKQIVRRQLFHATDGQDEVANLDEEKWTGSERVPPPSDAPRLYCILGDIDKDPEMYEKAWEVSNKRYARAQRSLGKHFYSARDFVKAAQAYNLALKVNQVNHGSWFALGCALLELQEWSKAAEAFSRTVALDDSDAESWSNLAVALLNIDPQTSKTQRPQVILDDEEATNATVSGASDPQGHIRESLAAFKRATHIKHTSHQIWSNVLMVACTLQPPSYTDIATAQRHILELRASKDGEAAVDVLAMDQLIRHVITSDEDGAGYDPSKPGLAHMVVELVDKHVVPLITSSAVLWKLVSKLSLWRKRPSSALEANEKAWRCEVGQPGWETGDEKFWEKIVDATVDLVDAYQSLGDRERTEGLGAGSGVVAKDWKFKARSAVRGILGRGKESWEGSSGWERLQECLADLKH